MRNVMLGTMLVILLTTSIGFADLTDGLMAYYPFNGNANDESGNGNDGTLEDDAVIINGVLFLDGVGDYVHVPDSTSLSLSTKGTIAAFINIDPTADLSHDKPIGIVNKTIGSTSPSQIEFEMVYHPRKILEGLICDDSHGDYVQYSDHDTRDGTWYHLAMTWGSGNISLYLGGTLVQTKSMTGSGVTAKGFDMSIGRHYHDVGGSWYYFPGMIDEVRIYNRELEPCEIQQLSRSTIEATVDIDPDTLNLGSQGKWVTCYIELPECFDVIDIDGATVTLDGIPAYIGKEGWARAGANTSNIMDHDEDGILERMVKFEKSAVQEYLSGLTGDVELMVSGELIDGPSFEGTDVIRIISK